MKRLLLPIAIIASFAVAVCLSGSTPTDRKAAESSSTELVPDEHHGRIAQLLALHLPREHLTHRDFDDAISRQALDNYIRSLDYERIYFLRRDIDRFNSMALQLDDQLKAGELQFAYDVFTTYKERVRDRFAFVQDCLAKGFDLTRDESLRWKRKDAPWPETNEEWDNLWRKRIKNEYLRRVLGKEVEAAFADETETDAEDEDDTADDDPETDEETFVDTFETPEAFIEHRYQQFLTTIEDSDSEWVMQKYLTAFTQAYDPHCEYLSPSSEEDFDIEMKLSLVGIGALLRAEDGAARIVRLIPGGPAARDTREKRLRPGDKIIAVAQDKAKPVSILHWPLYRAVRLIRGEKGTRVVLTVIPASDPTGSDTKIVDLVRDKVKLKAREAKSKQHTLDRNEHAYTFGVIELPAFYADLKAKRDDPNVKSSSRDVARILGEMVEASVDGIVLDLRSNGGGSLREAIEMTGLFIRTGPVVQVRERRGISVLPDNDPAIVYDGPLVVLVNRLSASASEILAAALQDYGRAIIVGDSKTHGKGSVQTILSMGLSKKLGALKVTNALFYRISGGSTQLRGVIPDIALPSPYDFMELGEDHLPNPLEWTEVSPVPFSPFQDLQDTLPALRKASEQRRASDERYQAYAERLARVKLMNEADTLSLNIDTRREQAREERELIEAQNELIEEASGEDDDDDAKPDVVLLESLHIMADAIERANAPQQKALEDSEE